VVSRQQAQDRLNAIHEQPVGVAQAAIAYYEGRGGGATVWWSRAASEAQARQQLERMVAKIRQGSYLYGHYQEFKRRAVTVHSFLGGGQTHYTYRLADQLYWISAPPQLIESVFDGLMR
jgi:hypothetical protein